MAESVLSDQMNSIKVVIKDQIKTVNIDKAMLEFFGMKRRWRKKNFIASMRAIYFLLSA